MNLVHLLVDSIKRRCCCFCRKRRYVEVNPDVIHLTGDESTLGKEEKPKKTYEYMTIQLQSHDDLRRSDTLTRHQLESLRVTQNGHITFVGERTSIIRHDHNTGIISVVATGDTETVDKWMDSGTWGTMAFAMGNHYDIIHVERTASLYDAVSGGIK